MRSTRPDVRNPLLQLPSARRLGEWLDGSTARTLARFLKEISEDARARAGECWRKHKAPMALYWKVVAVYARHLAQILRGISSQAIAENVPGRQLELETALETMIDAARRQPGNASMQGLADLYAPLVEHRAAATTSS